MSGRSHSESLTQSIWFCFCFVSFINYIWTKIFSSCIYGMIKSTAAAMKLLSHYVIGCETFVVVIVVFVVSFLLFLQIFRKRRRYAHSLWFYCAQVDWQRPGNRHNIKCGIQFEYLSYQNEMWRLQTRHQKSNVSISAMPELTHNSRT